MAMKNFDSTFWIKILLATMSVIALAGAPYSYYQVFRIIMLSGLLIILSREPNNFWKVIWLSSILLIQPFYKLPISKDTWKVIDFIWIIIFLYTAFMKPVLKEE